MLLLEGQIINVYQAPEYTNKKTGEVTPAKDMVQLTFKNSLRNGQERVQVVNMAIDEPKTFEELTGQTVRLPVSVYAMGRDVGFTAVNGGRGVECV